MWKVLARARNRFASDQRGNVGILFGFAAIPVIGLLGGAVDVARHNRYETTLLNAMDSAAFALVRRGTNDDSATRARPRGVASKDAEADAFVNNFIPGLVPWTKTDTMLHLARFDAIEIKDGWRVVAKGDMETAFLPVVGVRTMPLDLMAEVQMSGGKYEIALALDNTGSMEERGKIVDLREAANHLVDILYEEDGAEDRVKMALVPFTTTVNIRGEAFDPAWLDPTGEGLGEHRFDSFDREVDRLDIFDALGGRRRGADGLPTAWKGCVEARLGELDVDDTAPGDDPGTRWTPYLSPDGADEGSGPAYARGNSYLADQTGGSALDRLRNVDKYFRPIRLASFNEARGPNQACRGPIVELTNDEDRMRAAIKAMSPGGNTHINQGLVWGWRVLSPGEPFSQGVAYDDAETQKALVLLSDGVNTVGGYTSYGYVADGRLGSGDRRAKRQLDANVTRICEQVKARNIRLYMILFQENDRETQRIFEDCATVSADGDSLYYYAPDGEALKAAFDTIGNDLTSIRVSR